MLRSKKRKARLGESQVKKRTVVVRGHKSSVSVEQSFWIALKEIAGTASDRLIIAMPD
jgi:predicted DNA-binding ribbon-helix-helix protein